RRARLTRLLGFDRRANDATFINIASASTGADAMAELALLDRALRRLRPELQLAWMLRRVEGMGLADVAVACDCSLATAKRRIVDADQYVGRHLGSPVPATVDDADEEVKR